MLWPSELVILSLLPPLTVRLIDPATGSPRHIFVFGMTGSGKTHTVKRLISSRNIKRPTLILDWAGEYWDLGLETTYPQDLSMEGLESSQIVDAFSSAYQLTKPQEALLLRCLDSRTKISDVVAKLKEMPIRSASEAELKEALLRRLEPLVSLSLFEGDKDLSSMMSASCRLDLSLLPFEARRLSVNLILRLIYNKVTKGGGKGLIIVLEEAENVIPARRPEDFPSSGEIIVNELRKWGVSVLAVAQLPSQVSSPSFRNCDYIILHRARLTSVEADWLGLTEEEVERLARLHVGEALILHRGSKRWVKILKPKLSTKAKSQSKRSEKSNEIKDLDGDLMERIERLESKLSTIEGEVELLLSTLRDSRYLSVEPLPKLLELLEVSKRGELIMIYPKRELSVDELLEVDRFLDKLGKLDRAKVDGRPCWFLKV